MDLQPSKNPNQAPKSESHAYVVGRAYFRNGYQPDPAQVDPPLRESPYYLCQVCHNAVARFPREKHYDLTIFRWTKRLTYATPMVCAQCRIMRQPEVTRLGDGRRRLWKRAISLYLNEPYPSMGPGMARLFLYRQVLWVLGVAIRQVSKMVWSDLRRSHWKQHRTGPGSQP